MDSVLSQTAEYTRYEPWVGTRCFRLRNPCERVTWPNGAASPSTISRRSRTDSCSRGFPNRANAGGGSLARVLAADAIPLDADLTAVYAFPTNGRCAFGWGACSAARSHPLHDQ